MVGRLVSVFALALMFCTSLRAAEPVINFFPYCSKPRCVFSPGCCPDDYCPKPLPCAAHNWCGTCDDYCKKPLPCAGHNWCGTCDDYNKKCGPISMTQCLPPWFKCYPTCAPIYTPLKK